MEISHRPRRGVLHGRLAAVVASVSLAAGCSSAVDEPVPDFSPVPSSIVPGAAANPLDAVIYPDPVQQRAIVVAGEAVVTRCMADRGFDYADHWVFPIYQDPSEADDTLGGSDPERAAVNGMKSAMWMKAVTQDRSQDSELPEGFLDALFGDTQAEVFYDDDGVVIASYDPQSCAGLAKDEVTPDWVDQEHLLEIAYQILLESSHEVESDPRVIGAEEAWSTCMAARGHDYADLGDAVNADAFSGDLPTAMEIETAVASAHCQHDSGRLWTVSSVRAEHTETALAQHPGLITEWLALQERVVAGLPAGATDVES